MKNSLLKLTLAATSIVVAASTAKANVAKTEKVIAMLNQAPFGISGGDPIEVRTAPYNGNIIYQSSSNDEVVLNQIPRLGLKAHQVIKRIEVRAAGQGTMQVTINNKPISESILVSDKFEFQTYSFKVDQSIPLQEPLQVKIKVNSGELRFLDFSALMLKTSIIGESNGITSISKKVCDLNPAMMSHGWTLQIGANTSDRYFSSPSLLFSTIESNCKPMKFLCFVSEAENGKFAVSVNLRGEVYQKSGTLGLEDATKQLEKLQKSGFCAY